MTLTCAICRCELTDMPSKTNLVFTIDTNMFNEKSSGGEFDLTLSIFEENIRLSIYVNIPINRIILQNLQNLDKQIIVEKFIDQLDLLSPYRSIENDSQFQSRRFIFSQRKWIEDWIPGKMDKRGKKNHYFG